MKSLQVHAQSQKYKKTGLTENKKASTSRGSSFRKFLDNNPINQAQIHRIICQKNNTTDKRKYVLKWIVKTIAIIDLVRVEVPFVPFGFLEFCLRSIIAAYYENDGIKILHN